MSQSNIGNNKLVRKSETSINIICANCGGFLKFDVKYKENICCLEVFPCTDLDCFLSTNFAQENIEKIYEKLKKEFV